MKKHQMIAAGVVVSALLLAGCQGTTPTNTTTMTDAAMKTAQDAMKNGDAATQAAMKTAQDAMNNADAATKDAMAQADAMTKDAMTKEAGVSYVGGAAMYANKDIVSNVVNAPNLTTLVAAVKAAGLVDTLSGPGPFTVFGPDNDAFAKLPAGTVDTLVKPENKAQLVDILTYHVVPGIYTSADLKDGMTLTTVQGEMLKVSVAGGVVTITDSKGGSAKVTTADVMQKNGVAHVIDTVLMPTK